MTPSFHSEGVKFRLRSPRSTAQWINTILTREKKKLKSLLFVFCSDAYLLELNKRYLKHDTFTDILTFDYSQLPKTIEGEVFISVERVKENAAKFKTTLDNELHRVIAHGVLHLSGYQDKTKAQKAQMRKKEEEYLGLR